MNDTRPRRAGGLVKPVEERTLLGILLVIGSVLCFTGIDSSGKWLVTSGYPTSEVALVRYLVQLGIILAIFGPSYREELFRTQRPGIEVMRGLTLLSATFFNFLALNYLPLTVTSAVLFANPLIVCALSVPFLGEKVGWRRWLAILTGFAGVLVIIRPGGESFHWASILALASAASLASYQLLTRKIAGVDSVPTQQFYSAAVATAALLPVVFWQWVWPRDFMSLAIFVIMGLFGTVGHQFLTTALRLAPASTLAPFNYVQIVFMAAASWLVFNQPPDVWVFLGAPIVIGSGLYIWLRELRLGRKPVNVAPAAR